MSSAWWLWLGFVVHGRPFQLIVIWLFHRNLLPTTAPERGVAELAPGHPLARVRVEHGFELHPALSALAPLEYQPEMAVARHRALAGPGLCRSPTHGSGDSASARWLASHPLRFPMASTVAISGASGKTGYRIAEEVQRRGDHARLLLRATSQPPDSLQGVDQRRFNSRIGSNQQYSIGALNAGDARIEYIATAINAADSCAILPAIAA